MSEVKIKYCNVCGKEFDTYDYLNNFHIAMNAGYGSEFDGESIGVDFCCRCLDRLMTDYIIPKSKIKPI